MIRLLLLLTSLLIQRLLCWPGVHPWAGELLLPMVGLVGLSLNEKAWRRVLPGLWLGLAWDLALERVVGPGAIAWSAAGLVMRWVGSLLADRSARAWFALGAIGTLVVILVRTLAELPLGLAIPFGWGHLLRSSFMTATWCALVGWLLALDLPRRWHRYRARRLR